MHSNLYHLHILWPLVQKGCYGAIMYAIRPVCYTAASPLFQLIPMLMAKMHTQASNGHTKLIIMSFRWKYNIYKIRLPPPQRLKDRWKFMASTKLFILLSDLVYLR